MRMLITRYIFCCCLSVRLTAAFAEFERKQAAFVRHAKKILVDCWRNN